MDRIRKDILYARAHGIHTEIAGVSNGSSRLPLKKHALIFDKVYQRQKDDHMRDFEADTYPQKILLTRPPVPDALDTSLNTEVSLELVIDAAGKVHSATTLGAPHPELIEATADWKFIPAYKDGRPVASRFRMGVIPYR
jgi:hypothetical protein